MEFSELETPCYIVRKAEYFRNIEEIMEAFREKWNGNVVFGYSVKTNHFPYLMNVAKEFGWYSEVVSEDELEHSLDLGFAPNRIILNGPVKTEAIKKQLNYSGMINLDNKDEIRILLNNKNELKSSIGIRVSLGLEKYVPGETTVKDEKERFGFDCNEELPEAISVLKENGIKISGIHLHHSTSSRSLKVYECICEKALEIIRKYELGELEYVDIGGGFFGGNYFKGKPSIEEYSRTVTDILKRELDPDCITLVIEPGAAILATACDYLTSVINIRKHDNTRIVTVDGTCLHVNSFMKPKQVNPCTVINPGEELNGLEQVIGGSTCMEMDRLYPMGNDRILEKNSKLLFHCAGAYTMTHNSNFINAVPNVYLDENGKYTLLRAKNHRTMCE